MVLTIIAVALAATSVVNAFTIPSTTGLTSRRRTPLFAGKNGDLPQLSSGDAVLLIGPGFLQLNIAKVAKAAGLRPVIVAPQKNIDKFAEFVNDAELIKDATIGIPDPGEPFYGELKGVVFCAEDAVLPANLITTVLDWGDRAIYADPDGPQRVIACAPISQKINNEKSMGWMPIFNNDKKEKEHWKTFVTTYLDHPKSKGPEGSLIRFGSLLGGSVDGPDLLQLYGLDECVYKMSLENYRDLKERSFDRYRLGAQVLVGDTVNPKPTNQEKLEKDGIKSDEQRETFRTVGEYPEVDRANRHTVAQAVVQSLLRPTRPVDSDSACERSVPKEMTILSKCVQELPSDEEWDEMFANPGAASWPDPFSFDATQYGYELQES